MRRALLILLKDYNLVLSWCQVHIILRLGDRLLEAFLLAYNKFLLEGGTARSRGVDEVSESDICIIVVQANIFEYRFWVLFLLGIGLETGVVLAVADHYLL